MVEAKKRRMASSTWWVVARGEREILARDSEMRVICSLGVSRMCEWGNDVGGERGESVERGDPGGGWNRRRPTASN